MSDTTPRFVCPNGCSYKMEQLHRRIAELEELCEIYVPEKILRQMRDKKSPPEGWGA